MLTVSRPAQVSRSGTRRRGRASARQPSRRRPRRRPVRPRRRPGSGRCRDRDCWTSGGNDAGAARPDGPVRTALRTGTELSRAAPRLASAPPTCGLRRPAQAPEPSRGLILKSPPAEATRGPHSRHLRLHVAMGLQKAQGWYAKMVHAESSGAFRRGNDGLGVPGNGAFAVFSVFHCSRVRSIVDAPPSVPANQVVSADSAGRIPARRRLTPSPEAVGTRVGVVFPAIPSHVPRSRSRSAFKVARIRSFGSA